MAQSFTTDDGSILIIPGSYPTVKVQKSSSGLSATGVVMVIGEADAGPDFSLETDITENFFGPDEESVVVAKYKSGNLVDAFRAAVAPLNDVAITGAPSAIYLLKTNPSTRGGSNMTRTGLTNYGTLNDKTYGKTGNFIYWNVESDETESAPATGSFVFAPAQLSGAHTLSVRVNGTAAQTANVDNMSPATFVSTVNGLNNLVATGGTARNVLSGWTPALDTLALTAAGNVVTITGSINWTNAPSIGDVMVLPKNTDIGATADSIISGGANEKVRGVYLISDVTVNTITATKIRDLGTGSLTAPENDAGGAINAVTDLMAWAPITNVKNITGTLRAILNAGHIGVAKLATASPSAGVLTVTMSLGTFTTIPRIGDLVQISATSIIKGAGNENVGWYTVTSANATVLTLAVIGPQTLAAVVATLVAATTDLGVYAPVIDGTGKALEFALTAGADVVITDLLKTTAGAAVSWASTSALPSTISSTVEQSQTLNVLRSNDSTNESITEGGTIVLKVGYDGTTATLTVTNTGLTTVVVGGSGANLSIDFKDYTNVSSLATFINNQTGYTAAVGSSLVGQLPLQKTFLVNDVQTKKSVLDLGTYGICGEFDGSMPGRIKHDAYKFNEELLSVSVTVQLGTDVSGSIKVDAGLPETTIDPTSAALVNTFLTNGTKGGTTNTNVDAAIDACEKIRGNFLVTCFSQDAADDIVENLTESGSTYTVDSINALVKTHQIKMSTTKRRRHRQGFVSKRGTFTEAKSAANDLAAFRTSCAFQDVKVLDSTATIRQFHPWMLSVLAAGGQAAAFNKALVRKGINCSGIVMNDNTFTDQSDTDLEDALKNGLLVAKRDEDGRFIWVSDQTTYATDGNFVYNSIQAIYAADTVALTTARRMEVAFVGESLADVSASVALSYLKGIMLDLLRLKLLAGDDEAPLGFKNARIQISGNTMKVSLEIKLATAVMFIPISFLVTEVQSSAS